jgi:BASS family bile acid:Na+ symporter
MAPPDSTRLANAAITRIAATLHRFFLPALVATYALAGILPGPGTVVREFAVSLPGVGPQRISMLLLAVLLFCAAAVIEWSQVHEFLERPSTLLVGLIVAWLGPALLVMGFSALIPWLAPHDVTAGLIVGLALVAAMPVANSSAGWTQNARGNIALSLSLIIVSIILSPLVTPNLLKFMGWALSDADTRRIELVVTQFSGWSFILWVILPSLAGALAAMALGPLPIAQLKPGLRLTSLVTILVLNYANASLAIEEIWSGEPNSVLVLAAAMAVAVCLIGIVFATLQARAFGLSRGNWSALAFGLSMKHTGLALVLAGEFLKDQPRVILVVLLTTLAQHLAAGAIDLRLQMTQDSRDQEPSGPLSSMERVRER